MATSAQIIPAPERLLIEERSGLQYRISKQAEHDEIADIRPKREVRSLAHHHRETPSLGKDRCWNILDRELLMPADPCRWAIVTCYADRGHAQRETTKFEGPIVKRTSRPIARYDTEYLGVPEARTHLLL